MRQEQLRRRPRRQTRRAQLPPLVVAPAPAASSADELLERIDDVLEAA